MGLFDRLTFEDGLDVDFPNVDGDSFRITWQTKSLQHQPSMANFKVTSDGRLLEEVTEHERVPEEERPGYDEDIGGFETPFEKGHGWRKVHHGWTDTRYHGIIEFHATVDGEYTSLEAKFTDGKLVEITRNR